MAQRSLMSRLFSGLISLLILLPLAILAVLFTISNRDMVAVAFWPLPGSIDVPLYLMALPGLPVGFIVGGVMVWTGKRMLRVRAERAERRSDDLQRELSVMRIREEELRARAMIKGEEPKGLLTTG